MTDPCLPMLAHCIQHSGQGVWFAADGGGAILPTLSTIPAELLIATNRYDVFEQAQSHGIHCEFGDWPTLAPPCNAFYLRLCKEKSVNFHIANMATTQLMDGGLLSICGEKGEGIKTYYKTLAQVFDVHMPLQKSRDGYLAQFKRSESTPPTPFDDQNYSTQQTIGALNGQPVISKPGVYGWRKVDQGSQLLADTVNQQLRNAQGKSLLDLGCGYGYLCLATAHLKPQRLVATDNNAAALACCKANTEAHSLPAEVMASDCGNTLNERFDIILCNPPFHKAFGVDGTLTDRFLSSAAQLLATKGTAFFVVNSFIGIEKKASAYFKHIELLANNSQFKVLALRG